MAYRLLDDAVEAEILESPNQGRYLILEQHPEAPGHWLVQSFTNSYRFDLREIIGSQSIVSPANLEEFVEAALEGGYEIVFGEEPYTILDAYAHLNDAPEVELESHFEETVNGFLPFQVQGFNKLKDLDGGVAQWSTGTGKSVLAAGWVKYHEQQDNFDVCFYVVKSHNKVNAARGLFKLAGITSLILDGTIAKREKVYLELFDAMERGEKVVVITNYEKFRDDFCAFEKRKNKNKETYEVVELNDWAEPIFKKRLAMVWDEMPTKLKNRDSRLYRAVVKCLYRTNAPATNWDLRRPASLRQLMLSATPIENSPADWYNCVRILDPRVYGSVKTFEDRYATSYDPFGNPNWNMTLLPEIALRAAHIVHQVDKKHPDIAAQFPEVIVEPRIIDWHPDDRKVYDKLTKELAAAIENEDGEEERQLTIFAALAVMQMLCNAPATVNDSAALREAWEESMAEWDGDEEFRPERQGTEAAAVLLRALDGKKLTNDKHTKIAELKADLLENYPNEKIVLFTALNASIMPTLEGLLQEWDVSYVRYDGTTKQKQEAEDRFKSDPDIRVFLSSDKGSDSINLEVASVVINYDGPYKWTTLEQRNNRVHRITSGFESVRFISYEMWDSVDSRKRKIREKKKAFHDGVFGGVIRDEAISATTTKDDLMWMLRG